MTPKDFLKRYRLDHKMVDGTFFPFDPLTVEAGDRIGVVLFNLGGPRNEDEVEPFLYNLFMDPAIIDIPLPAFLREPLCRFIARKRSVTVREEYGLIGGNSPLNKHSEAQAALLERALKKAVAGLDDVNVSVYLAMRYAWPSSEDAIGAMKEDGINKVVLLPLYPQYSKTTTGASLVFWKELENEGILPEWPTSAVFEYATHPSLTAAFNARIDEALYRFPEDARNEVHLLFSAHGTPLYEMTKRKDPYCCLVHATVEQVMKERSDDRPFRVAFQSKVGPAEWLTPATPDALEEMAEEGIKRVLVVPIAFVSDHVETAFELDMEVREEAEEAGIEHYEVMTGLNDHPGFIDALASVTKAHLGLDKPPPFDRTPATERKLTCHQCIRNAEPLCWHKRQAADGAVLN